MNPADLYEQAATFADDVLAAVAAAGAPAPGRVLVAPYAAVADDGCCDGAGQLAVVLDGLYRSSTFPLPEADVSCAVEAVALFRVRLSRCVTTVAEDGTAPSPETLSEEAALGFADAAALYVGAETFAARYGYAYLGTVTPAGPEGGCGAYEVTATVAPDDFVSPAGGTP